RSADKYLDVLPQGVNKGSTLTKLVQHLGVDPGNVLVAGDTLNDLSLYHTGYRGVVVGQAEAGLSEATAGMDNVHHARSPGAGGILEAIKLDGVPDLRPVPAKVPTGDAQLVVVYHRLPFAESLVEGEIVRSRHSSSNGIIPTLLGCFEGGRPGSWVAWTTEHGAESG